MELFVESKNRAYARIRNIINVISSHPEMAISHKELMELAQEGGLVDTNPALMERLLNRHQEGDNLYLLDEMINRADPTQPLYALTVHQQVLPEPFLVEKIWLKGLLQEPKLALFLAPELIDKLRIKLADYPDLLQADYLTVKASRQRDSRAVAELRESLQVILQAIREQRKLSYSYQAKNGSFFAEQQTIPYKLEYSVKDDRFYLIHYPDGARRFVKSILQYFSQVQLSQEHFSEEQLEQLLQEQVVTGKVGQPAVVKIKDEKNALERAMYLFSCFDAELVKDYPDSADSSSFFLRIQYYSFDEEEVVARILSLGKQAVVLEPPELREKVIAIIRAAVDYL